MNPTTQIFSSTIVVFLALAVLSCTAKVQGPAGDREDGDLFFPPELGIPKWLGGGYGGGYGGPDGGRGKGWVSRPRTVCRKKGPCHGKTVVCPAKCFTSFSRYGKGFGAGGGGGGCTIDCSKHCVASCLV